MKEDIFLKAAKATNAKMRKTVNSAAPTPVDDNIPKLTVIEVKKEELALVAKKKAFS